MRTRLKGLIPFAELNFLHLQAICMLLEKQLPSSYEHHLYVQLLQFIGDHCPNLASFNVSLTDANSAKAREFLTTQPLDNKKITYIRAIINEPYTSDPHLEPNQFLLWLFEDCDATLRLNPSQIQSILQLLFSEEYTEITEKIFPNLIHEALAALYKSNHVLVSELTYLLDTCTELKVKFSHLIFNRNDSSFLSTDFAYAIKIFHCFLKFDLSFASYWQLATDFSEPTDGQSYHQVLFDACNAHLSPELLTKCLEKVHENARFAERLSALLNNALLTFTQKITILNKLFDYQGNLVTYSFLQQRLAETSAALTYPLLTAIETPEHIDALYTIYIECDNHTSTDLLMSIESLCQQHGFEWFTQVLPALRLLNPFIDKHLHGELPVTPIYLQLFITHKDEAITLAQTLRQTFNAKALPEVQDTQQLYQALKDYSHAKIHQSAATKNNNFFQPNIVEKDTQQTAQENDAKPTKTSTKRCVIS